MQNDQLIRKEKNKSQVFKSIKERSNGIFSVGIVDSDNDDVEPFLKGLQVENRFFICDELELIKIGGQPHFIILIHPKEFEKWIVKFLENNCNKSLQDFGYDSYEDFEDDSKVIPEKITTNERFKTVIRYVVTEQVNSENHISKLKMVLDFLLANPYQADINELKNV